MALSLKDAETDRLARAVAKLTGESLTEAVRRSLAERLDREQRKRGRTKGLAERLDEIAKEWRRCPTTMTGALTRSRLRRVRRAALMVLDTSAIVAVLFDEPGHCGAQPPDRG